MGNGIRGSSADDYGTKTFTQNDVRLLGEGIKGSQLKYLDVRGNNSFFREEKGCEDLIQSFMAPSIRELKLSGRFIDRGIRTDTERSSLPLSDSQTTYLMRLLPSSQVTFLEVHVENMGLLSGLETSKITRLHIRNSGTSLSAFVPVLEAAKELRHLKLDLYLGDFWREKEVVGALVQAFQRSALETVEIISEEACFFGSAKDVAVSVKKMAKTLTTAHEKALKMALKGFKK